MAVGLLNAGFDIIWACDFDKHCRGMEARKRRRKDYVIEECEGAYRIVAPYYCGYCGADMRGEKK